jgi:hypothetical protein
MPLQSYNQPFGIPLSFNKWWSLRGIDKVMTWIIKWLFGKICCNEEKGISETLIATGQSGLTVIRLLGRSGASSQHSRDDEESEITMRLQASWDWLSETRASRCVIQEKKKRSNLPERE